MLVTVSGPGEISPVKRILVFRESVGAEQAGERQLLLEWCPAKSSATIFDDPTKNVALREDFPYLFVAAIRRDGNDAIVDVGGQYRSCWCNSHAQLIKL